MTINLSRMNSRLIRNTDHATAFAINNLFERGIISDFSEDGWVLYQKEWYPYTTFIERMSLTNVSL
jgi:hypothetical protein